MTLDEACRYMETSILHDRVPQAIVVSAPPRGAGEAFTSHVLERLFCQDSECVPCGTCRCCSMIHKGTHPDVFRIEPQKKSRVISMEQMRDFLGRIHSTSFEGGWKCGVIVSADCLNASSANAFLKTLEEPPERTLFLLLTDSPQRLLPTLISRCQRLQIDDADASLPSEEDCQQLIAILNRPEQNAGAISAFGQADRMVAFLKQRKAEIEKEEKQNQREDEDESIEKDTLDARIGARYREWRQGVLRAMLHWYRDIFLLVCEGDATNVFFKEYLDQLRERAATCSYRQGLAQVRAVETVVTQLNRNLSESLIFENLFYSERFDS